jgi:hypothetical protein
VTRRVGAQTIEVIIQMSLFQKLKFWTASNTVKCRLMLDGAPARGFTGNCCRRPSVKPRLTKGRFPSLREEASIKGGRYGVAKHILRITFRCLRRFGDGLTVRVRLKQNGGRDRIRRRGTAHGRKQTGEVFNQRVLPVIEGDCIWKGRAAQGVTLPSVSWDTVYSEDRPPVEEFAFGMRPLACDI